MYSSVIYGTTTFPASTETFPNNPAISISTEIELASLNFDLDPVFIATDLSQEIIDTEVGENDIEVNSLVTETHAKSVQ